LRRLWRDESEESMWKCWFCSGCVRDNIYGKHTGKLKIDEDMEMRNRKFRVDRIIWFEETQKAFEEEKKKNSSYIKLIEEVFSSRNFNAKDTVSILIQSSERKDDLSTKASQALERGTYLPNALFIHDYYLFRAWKSNLITESAKEMYKYDWNEIFQIFTDTYKNFDEYGKWLINRLFEIMRKELSPKLIDKQILNQYNMQIEELIWLTIATWIL
jgi:hypothetical protein